MKHLTIALLFVTTAAHAALPPTAESLRRFRAVSESKDIYLLLGPTQVVKSIQDNGNGSFTVVTHECALNVKVETVQTTPPQMVPQLKVTAGQANCLP